MSKEHHFTVCYNTDYGWEITFTKFDEDSPIYDTETETWSGLVTPEDHRLDEKLFLSLADSIKQLNKKYDDE